MFKLTEVGNSWLDLRSLLRLHGTPPLHGRRRVIVVLLRCLHRLPAHRFHRHDCLRFEGFGLASVVTRFLEPKWPRIVKQCVCRHSAGGTFARGAPPLAISTEKLPKGT